MFKIIKNCPLCGSVKRSEVIKNSKNIYSYFLSRILNLRENFILRNMENYKCKKCKLIYKKKWLYPKFVEKIYKDYQPTHPGGLNTLKKNFGKKKFIELAKKYIYFHSKKKYEFSDRAKREIIKILNSTNNNKNNYIKFKKKFIEKLVNNDVEYIRNNYSALSNLIDRPKTYSQFSGFKSHEISSYLNKVVNLKSINSYAEVGCPLWGNYNYFKKPWIRQYFVNTNEKNFWKTDKKISNNCLKYLSKRIKVLNKKKLKQIDFVGIYNFLDHLENPLKFFKKEFKDIRFYGIICEDFDLSKKIDCQHFSSWNYKSLIFLSKKIGYTIYHKPLELSNSIYKLYILKKNDEKIKDLKRIIKNV
tara:strand:+ start:17445 stop:18524 length:1080 start_codon:yes stop_codon:yes gene_type:complete